MERDLFADYAEKNNLSVQDAKYEILRIMQNYEPSQVEDFLDDIDMDYDYIHHALEYM